MHAVGGPEVAAPCESPFSENAHNIAIHLWRRPLVVLGGVDVEGSPVRMARWRAKSSCHAVVPAYVAPAVSVGVCHINESLQSLCANLAECTLNCLHDNLVTVIAQWNVVKSVAPQNVVRLPSLINLNSGSTCWSVGKFPHHLLQC